MTKESWIKESLISTKRLIQLFLENYILLQVYQANSFSGFSIFIDLFHRFLMQMRFIDNWPRLLVGRFVLGVKMKSLS